MAITIPAGTGHLGSLTPDQQRALEQFKTELTTEGVWKPEVARFDDYLALRFLRARKFQLAAAKDMFTANETWRTEQGADTIAQTFEFPEAPVVHGFYPRYYHKTDKEGRPIYIEALGKINPSQLFQVTTVERMLRNHVYQYEKLINYRLPACSTAAKHHVETSCTILDLKGVPLSSFASVSSLVNQISSIGQNYYPEMMGKMFIINVPMLFTAVWAVVKQFLDEVTVSKISILGSGYKSELLKLIDPANLPAQYGGTCTCANGCDVSDIGPWNDGSVPGYPQKTWERLNILYGTGTLDRLPEADRVRPKS